jgi:hypothetical protein
MIPNGKRIMTAQSPADSLGLVQKIAAQNRDAFGQFYDLHSPLVYALALRMLRTQGTRKTCSRKFSSRSGARRSPIAPSAAARRPG